MGENIKFYNENEVDGDCTFSFTSASADLDKYLYDNKRGNKLISSGSDDLTPEVWRIDFPASVTIDSIFIDNHNIKSGTLKYSTDGITYASDFSTAISWSGNADTTNYYEFNSVAVVGIELTMNTTISADDEKYVGQLRALSQIGEVETNPSEFDHNFPESSVTHQTSQGGNVYISFGAKFRVDMMFSDASQNDVDLFLDLKGLGVPFYVYPNGGQSDLAQIGFRPQDMYLVNYTNPFKAELKAMLLGIGNIVNVILEEV